MSGYCPDCGNTMCICRNADQQFIDTVRACEECSEYLGRFAATPQFGCHDCWLIIKQQLAQKDEEIEKLRRINDQMGMALNMYEADDQQLREELRRERECVDFYADRRNWSDNGLVFQNNKYIARDGEGLGEDSFETGGKRARECQLKRSEG